MEDNEFSNYYDNDSSSYYSSNDMSNFYNNSASNDTSNSNYYGNSNMNSYSSSDDYYAKIDDFYSKMNDDNLEEQNKKKVIPLDKKRLVIVIALSIVLISLIILLFRSCGKGSPDIKLSEESITLKVGQSKYISYEIINTNNILPATFSSVNPSVATVDETGKVTGVSAGTTSITLSYKVGFSRKTKKCEVTVKK